VALFPAAGSGSPGQGLTLGNGNPVSFHSGLEERSPAIVEEFRPGCADSA